MTDDYNGARGVIWGCLIALAAWPLVGLLALLAYRLVVGP